MKILFVVNALHTIKFLDTISEEHEVLAVTACPHFKAAFPSLQLIDSYNQLQSLVDSHLIDIVIPSDTEYAEPGFQNLKRTHCFFVSAELCSSMDDKATFFKLSQTLDLPVPETLVVSTERIQSEIRNLPDRYLDGAFLIKPNRSCNGIGVQTLRRNTKPQMVNDCDHWLIQRKVSGRDLSMTALCNGGEVLGNWIYASILNNPNSSMTIREMVTDPNIVNQCSAIAHRVVQKTGYTGFLGFDFILDDDGLVYVLEANPCLTQGVLWMPKIDRELGERMISPNLATKKQESPDFPSHLKGRGNKTRIDNFYCLRSLCLRPWQFTLHFWKLFIPGSWDYRFMSVIRLLRWLIKNHGLSETIRFIRTCESDLLPSHHEPCLDPSDSELTNRTVEPLMAEASNKETRSINFQSVQQLP